MAGESAEDIRRMLDDRIEQVLDALNPGWARKGDTAYLTPKGPKDLGSFTVSLGGRSKMPRGCWHRFSQSIGGGSVELVSYIETGRKDAYRESFAWAKEFLGIEDRRQETPEEIAERERRKAAQREQQEREAAKRKAEAAAQAEQRKQSAAEVWKATKPLKGTLGEAYLVERGLPPIDEWPWNPDETLRFHPALDFEPNWKAGLFPAIVGKVADSFGVGAAVWQIYLDKDRPHKADLSPSPKIGRGPAAGGAIRLGGIGSHIGVAEGIESALAYWVLEGYRRPVWACLSTSGMTSFEPPMVVERITICPDSDRGMITNGRICDPPGITAARGLQRRMREAGVRCDILDISTLGDALDLLQTRRKYEQKERNATAPNQSRCGADHHRESVGG